MTEQNNKLVAGTIFHSSDNSGCLFKSKPNIVETVILLL